MLSHIGLGAAAGLAIGIFIAWVLGRQRTSRLQQQLVERTDAQDAAQRALDSARQELAEHQKAAAERDANRREELAGLKATRDAEQKSAEERLEVLTNAREELSSEFRLLAAEIFRENSTIFAKQNQENMGHLLKPVDEALKSLQNATQQLEVKREGAYGSVLSEIKNIQETHQSLRRETAQLVKALRAPKARGNWGELQLKRCIEFAGMVEHASFDIQVFVRADDLSRQPDCVIYLPNGRTIVIDAKTPLDAFLDASDEADESERAFRMAAHAASVRGHVKQLSEKTYWKQFKDSPDFVVCFLPTEALFSAALEHDPELIEFGSNSSVILATPTTLIALLKAVAYGWQQMEITRNAIAIKESGEKLYDKLATAQRYFSRLGSALDSAVGQYNSLIGCMEGGKGAFVQARRLHELGLGQDEIPVLKRLDSDLRAIKEDDWPHKNGLALAAEAE